MKKSQQSGKQRPSHVKNKSTMLRRQESSSLVIDMSAVNCVDEAPQLSFLSPANSNFRTSASRSLSGTAHTSVSKKSSRTKEFLSQEQDSRLLRSSDSETIFAKALRADLVNFVEKEVAGLRLEIAGLRDQITARNEDAKVERAKLQFQLDELMVAKQAQEETYKSEIRDLKERLTAFETDLTYWNLKEYHQPRQVFLLDKQNIDQFLTEGQPRASIITKVLNASQQTPPQLAESLHIPAEDPTQYLNSCQPKELSILQLPHENNNPNLRYRQRQSRVLDAPPVTLTSEEDKQHTPSDTSQSKNPNLLQVKENDPEQDLDASLLKALDLTANLSLNKGQRQLGKHKSQANITLPDFLKAPSTISEKFLHTSRKLKFMNHLNNEKEQQPSRDPNMSLPLAADIKSLYRPDPAVALLRNSQARKKTEDTINTNPPSRLPSKEFNESQLSVSTKRQSKNKRLHSCEIKLELPREAAGSRKPARSHQMGGEPRTRVSYLKFNRNSQLGQSTPTSSSSVRPKKMVGPKVDLTESKPPWMKSGENSFSILRKKPAAS